MGEDKQKMYYRHLGNTGMLAGVFSFGFWATFGVKEGLSDEEGIVKAMELIRICREAGVTLFDNAEAYGDGKAESIFGEAYARLQKEDPELYDRRQLILTTKIYWGGTKGVNERGISKKRITEGLDNSLKRLQLDHVDIVFCHRPDKYTATDTVVRAMTDAIRSGKAMSWGTSEWPAQLITEAYWIAKMEGLEPPQMEQPQYNMFHRERVEKEFAPLFRHTKDIQEYRNQYNIGLTVWSPLASGLLTGKYKDGIPEDSRLATPGYEWLKKKLEDWKEDGKIDSVSKLATFAKEKFDCSVSQLALAWCAKNPNVTTVLLGATKPEQLKENLGALAVLEKLTDEHMDKIDEILGNKPDAWVGNYRDFDTI